MLVADIDQGVGLWTLQRDGMALTAYLENGFYFSCFHLFVFHMEEIREVSTG